ncbi:MAG: SsrA-binding protein SmpB [Candidatus Omnitrophica bacterium]|nr:SsrA-binding protein SmpB [Candidatus Omnitrophota bacterium]
MGKVIATNKKALRDYFVVETLEAGIELKGSEVKSVRAANADLNDGYARIEGGEAVLYNMYIAPYVEASYMNVDPLRPRRLLLKKAQITKLMQQASQKGCTLIPLRLYFSDRGFAKIELAVCKGKRMFDKRQAIKEREVGLAIKRTLRARR